MIVRVGSATCRNFTALGVDPFDFGLDESDVPSPQPLEPAGDVLLSPLTDHEKQERGHVDVIGPSVDKGDLVPRAELPAEPRGRYESAAPASEDDDPLAASYCHRRRRSRSCSRRRGPTWLANPDVDRRTNIMSLSEPSRTSSMISSRLSSCASNHQQPATQTAVNNRTNTRPSSLRARLAYGGAASPVKARSLHQERLFCMINENTRSRRAA